MTVAELITHLAEMPPNAPVDVAAEDGPGRWAPARSVWVEGDSVLISGDER